jgi:hypothetical protein
MTCDYVNELHSFVRGETLATDSPAASLSGTAIILFADIVDSTR